MSNIHISIRDKLPQYEPATLICGNSDYRIVWELDGEWAAYDTKTMRVCLADGTYQDVLFQGTEAALPVLTVPGWISVVSAVLTALGVIGGKTVAYIVRLVQRNKRQTAAIREMREEQTII